MRIKRFLPDVLAARADDVYKHAVGLVKVRNRVAHSRLLELDDLPKVVEFAEMLVRVPGYEWDNTKQARADVKSNPGNVLNATASLIVDPAPDVAHNLPAPDFDETSLLGRRQERQRVMQAIDGAWPVISILGDGGVGKTALALQVCYDLIEQADCPFEALVWVTAKNAQLTSQEIVRIEGAARIRWACSPPPRRPWAADGETTRGSKVLITNRIGVRTEYPITLTGIGIDDARKLMRILGRRRGINLLTRASDADLIAWANMMRGHPAHIKWFVSGIQAGELPEQLLSDDGLLLDFCMTNVFQYLSEDAKAALRSMIVVPGAHTLAELAFLNEYDAARTQAVVLALTTINFVSQVSRGASSTALELSDFARRYLQKTLSPVSP
ncbi:hypothetical protein ETD86_13930 [Nonomuraea turkmeniaca]|uniref:NB-ARC domain-containing protein n=1 Tax=Nonomuraea turkmeniaca TaxID=103838 RepID=A0A5S4FMC3_9ACTN|nr:hypothetical protein [Nonomuraea turkmeniaca]TMR21759.1 hypothetical protein ETD86_13930 [Nonomuraea turkmeniaca]